MRGLPSPGQFIEALLGGIGGALSGGPLNLPNPFEFKRRRCRSCSGRRHKKKRSVSEAMGVSPTPSVAPCPT